MLYPTASDYWNKRHQSGAIMEYAEAVKALDNKKFKEMWDLAVEYNYYLNLLSRGVETGPYPLPPYETILDVSGNGMMAYIDIPKIKVHLPIYHGTDEGVLQSGVGHYETSSFPIGGNCTHCVLTGHTGLPSARLFTDLDQIREDDIFIIETLGEVLTYKVDKIKIVWPYETDDLLIEQGKDYCTLVTCTPYGVNDHRLLIRGERIETTEEVIQARETAVPIEQRIEPMYIALAIVGVIFVAIIILALRPKKKEVQEDDSKERETNK